MLKYFGRYNDCCFIFGHVISRNAGNAFYVKFIFFRNNKHNFFNFDGTVWTRRQNCNALRLIDEDLHNVCLWWGLTVVCHGCRLACPFVNDMNHVADDG